MNKTADKQRDKNGKFKEGNTSGFKKGGSGNPSGRPKKEACLTSLLKEEIEKIHPTDKDKKTWKQLIVEATMRLAIKGNATALKEIWGRCDGKVVLPIDAPGDLTFIISEDFKPKVKGKRE